MTDNPDIFLTKDQGAALFEDAELPLPLKQGRMIPPFSFVLAINGAVGTGPVAEVLGLGPVHQVLDRRRLILREEVQSRIARDGFIDHGIHVATGLCRLDRAAKGKGAALRLCCASMASTPPRGVPESMARQLSVPAPFTLNLHCEQRVRKLPPFRPGMPVKLWSPQRSPKEPDRPSTGSGRAWT
ncbi:hypothetical protein [Gemmobacter sp. 24YEA27]|uniref:hypothetical protein n=1 Tax=Gemmobacter sp. 24YEA27 TaxID=3040672 RepID=UPI0024B36F02|nr:hypothetical protein [Gemmobacter sp. 24YEA27]